MEGVSGGRVYINWKRMLARSSALLASERSMAVSMFVYLFVCDCCERVGRCRKCLCMVATPEWLASQCFSNRGAPAEAATATASSSSTTSASCHGRPKNHPAIHTCTTRPVCSPDIRLVPENGFIVLITHHASAILVTPAAGLCQRAATRR